MGKSLLFFLLLNGKVSALEEGDFREQFLAVEINKQSLDEIGLFIQDDEGALYASSHDMRTWGLKTIDGKVIKHRNESYYNLNAVNGLKYQIDNKQMIVNLTVPVPYFYGQELNLTGNPFVIPMDPSPGAYVDYDTIAQKDSNSKQIGGVFAVGLFNGYGTGFTDFLAQNLTNSGITCNNAVRLNSYWQVDNPIEMQSLILGDSYTVPGMWGNTVGFGGIQYKTNFGTQPSFITFPLPSARGEAVVPSSIDLFINDARTKKVDTMAGPFRIDNIPVTTGSGTINFVTTDFLGRQQQVTVPYYVSNTLLKPGLTNFAYSLGFIRKNFGRQSNDYGKPAFTGTYQIGLSEVFTPEVRGELLAKQQTGGLGGSYLIDALGVANLAGAISQRNNKPGYLVATGFQRQSLKGVTLGTNVQFFSRNFVQLGINPCFSPKSLITSFVGLPLFPGASLGVSYVRQANRFSPTFSFVNVGYNQTLGLGLSLNITAQINVEGPENKAVFLTLTYALTENTTANVGGMAQKHSNQGTVQVARNLPPGPGYGYNLYAANGQNKTYLASLSGQNDTGTLTGAVAHQEGITGGQIQAKGSLAFMDQNLYLSRIVGQSFAVIKVPGYEDVSVYSQNQLIGYTDQDGDLFVPNLLPYQNNPLRLELQDLPLDAELKTLDMNAIPFYRSGLVLNFPIKSSSSALANLVMPSREPVPTGTTIKLKNDTFPVGYEGEVYMTGLEPLNALTFIYKNETYSCDISYKKTKNVLPHLGKIQCIRSASCQDY